MKYDDMRLPHDEERLLREAMEQLFEEDLARLRSAEPLPLSPRTEARFRRKLRRKQACARFYRHISPAKALRYSLIIALLLALSLLCALAFGFQFYHFIVRPNAVYAEIRLSEDETASAVDIPADCPLPSALPRGYLIKSYEDADSVRILTYAHRDTGAKIRFYIYPAGSKLNIDNEVARSSSEYTINGMPAHITEKGSMCAITWSQNGQLFSIEAPLSADDMIKIAESVKKEGNST